MNLITMSGDKISEDTIAVRYKRVPRNTLAQAATYLSKFVKTGDVSIPQYLVKASDGVFVEDVTVRSVSGNMPRGLSNNCLIVFKYEPVKNGLDKLLDRTMKTETDCVWLGYVVLFEKNTLAFNWDIMEDEVWLKLGVRKKADLPKWFQECANWILERTILSFCEIQTKAFNTRHEVIRIQKEAEDDERRSSTAKGANRPTTSRVVKLTGDITYSIVADTSLPRQFTRHCEAWEVRGHYRHYRSGKVVFVRPHVRGAGAVKDKQYSV